MRFHQHLAVLGENFLSTVRFPCSVFIFIIIPFVAIVIAYTRLLTEAQSAVCIFISTIDITDITASEDITITVGKFCISSYLTTVNIDLGLSEDVTVGVELTTLTEVVVTTSTAKDVAMYVTTIEFHIGLSCLIDTLQGSYRVFFTRHFNNTTSDCRNLSTTKE